MTRLIPAQSSTQPSVDPKFIIYGAKKLPTVKVKLKGSDREIIINASDYDPDLHQKVT